MPTYYVLSFNDVVVLISDETNIVSEKIISMFERNEKTFR